MKGRWIVAGALPLLGCSSFNTVFDSGEPPFDAGWTPDDATVLPLDATIFVDVVVEANLPFDAPADVDMDVDGPTGCAVEPDGTPCVAAPDPCHTDGTCQGGQCMAPGVHVDGYNWDTSDTTARCCGGSPVHTTTNENCNACGIKCNTSNSESCQLFNGQYFCRGCVASSLCWSHCCSTKYSPYSCAASNCTTGSCSDTYCPPNTHCVVGTNTSNYCAY